MESHPCEKTRGVGLPVVAELEQRACQHVDARGHYCRMLAAQGSPLCTHHARKAQRHPPDAVEALASEVLDSADDFQSQAGLNAFLGNVVKQFVRKRISRRDAVTMAYLGQLLLSNIAALDRLDERALQSRAKIPQEAFIMDGATLFGAPLDWTVEQVVRRKAEQLAERP